jgi:HSP20 family protein
MAKKKPSPEPTSPELRLEEAWMQDEIEGQLSVDVFQADGTIVVKSTIAGVHPDDLELFLNRDMLTIRGERSHEEKVSDKDFFLRECYWGKFSRTIILPSDVKADGAKASLKDGVLTITLPKAEHAREIPVKWLS